MNFTATQAGVVPGLPAIQVEVVADGSGLISFAKDAVTASEYKIGGLSGQTLDMYYTAVGNSTNNANMLSGGTLRPFQKFNAVLDPGAFPLVMPADLDGPAPPPGTPQYFARRIDEEASGIGDPTTDYIEVFEFDVNWKLFAEAGMEGYHIKPAHKETFYPFGYDNLNIVESVGRNGRITFPFQRIESLREVPSEQRQVEGLLTYVYHLFPNVVIAVLTHHTTMLVLEPMIAVLLGAVVLGETLSRQAQRGLALALAGMLLLLGGDLLQDPGTLHGNALAALPEEIGAPLNALRDCANIINHLFRLA